MVGSTGFSYARINFSNVRFPFFFQSRILRFQVWWKHISKVFFLSRNWSSNGPNMCSLFHQVESKKLWAMIRSNQERNPSTFESEKINKDNAEQAKQCRNTSKQCGEVAWSWTSSPVYRQKAQNLIRPSIFRGSEFEVIFGGELHRSPPDLNKIL